MSYLDPCLVCDGDAAYLRSSVRPAWEELEPRVTLADLFSGCGGLTLGVAEAARSLGMGVDIRLAVDSDRDPLHVYQANFPNAVTKAISVESLFDGDLDADPTDTEKSIVSLTGPVAILVAGPPCQGHSDLNNHTRRSDPRNLLYVRVARAAQVLHPTVVIIENVPTITHDVAKASEVTMRALQAEGYRVASGVVHLARLGVPQERRRHVVLAMRGTSLDPTAVLSGLPERCARHSPRGVRWAIGDLSARKGYATFDLASTPNEENRRRIDWLFDNDEYNLPNKLRPTCHQSDHSYRSMYGRLRWDSPAQTVTTGFGSMGQGRYVHPAEPRTITPHEAARLQMFPDLFDFSSARTRGALARMIGNAVPHVLSMSIGMQVLPVIRDVADSKVGPPQLAAATTGGH